MIFCDLVLFREGGAVFCSDLWFYAAGFFNWSGGRAAEDGSSTYGFSVFSSKTAGWGNDRGVWQAEC